MCKTTKITEELIFLHVVYLCAAGEGLVQRNLMIQGDILPSGSYAAVAIIAQEAAKHELKYIQTRDVRALRDFILV